jgi:glycosyltransferase involved in cell wall biosynthesis
VKNDPTPLVSVLIPLYNHSRYIRRCLDSILEDGYPRIEIVIIDDGSRDDSVALARQWYAEQVAGRIERFELESRPNKGVTRTVNELIAKAHGDYLVFVASDDFLLPGGITARLEYLQSHPAKRAVFGDCIVVDDGNSKTHDSGIVDLYGGHIKCLMNEELLALELIFNWCVTGPGFMARRELFDEIGLYDESLTVEDWDMYLRIAAPGLLGFIPNPVAAYRYHGGNSILNLNSQLAQLTSLKRTAWKNHRAFHGVLKYGLLRKYFSLKKDIAGKQKQTVTRFFSKTAFKLLYWVSTRRYEKIIGRLHAGSAT